MSAYTISVISTLSPLLPIILLIGLRGKGLLALTLLLYLSTSLIVDSLQWYAYVSSNIPTLLDRFLFALESWYVAIEMLFFALILSLATERPIWRKNIRWAGFIMVLFWAIAFFGLRHQWIFAEGSIEGITNILFAFISASIALEIVEKSQDPIRQLGLWISAGIFFFCFSTFFILVIKETNLGSEIWFSISAINIFTNLIISAGIALVLFSKARAD